MAERFEADKLHSELDVLVNYTDIERDLDRRFRESYSPFSPTIHRPVTTETLDHSSPISTTSYILKAHLPTAAPEEDSHTKESAMQYSSEEEASLKESMVQEIGAIEKREQVSKWQGGVGLNRPVSTTNKHNSEPAPIADHEMCLNNTEAPELPTEKVTSYSGSENGTGIQPTGEIQINKSPAEGALDDSSSNFNDDLSDGEKPVLFKRERKTSPGSPDGFVFKRRRSARIAALLAKSE
ncbi:hypothetical protein BDV23DRAFT_184634 [Aspergillus alliaceus]|uniref:Uncharacterized protein n=1 Tax=Petromyces alliaceus TaxID=209559 RepID=A0A5N7C666_PETAA|nr:hypothetical protein BDV23DRAFT_184634 [Aspergillus alliaceus]